MISKNLRVEYLHPGLWRNLGVIIEHMHPLKYVLSVYTDAHGKKKCMDGAGCMCHPDVKEESFSESRFFEEHPEIEEVRFFTPEGLRYYEERVQKGDCYDRSIDAYVKQMYELQKETPGIFIATNPRVACRCIWERLEDMCPAQDGILFLWIEREGELFFNCILLFRNRELVKITTTDRYDLSYNQYETCREKIRQEFPGIKYDEIKMELQEWQKRTQGWYLR